MTQQPKPQTNHYYSDTDQSNPFQSSPYKVDDHRRPRSPLAHNGLWLIIIGLIIAVSQFSWLIPATVWGVLLFLPLAWALVGAYRCVRASGTVSTGRLWLIFGALFPAAAGLNELTGRQIDYTWVVVLGFVAVGLAMMSGRAQRRCAR